MHLCLCRSCLCGCVSLMAQCSFETKGRTTQRFTTKARLVRRVDTTLVTSCIVCAPQRLTSLLPSLESCRVFFSLVRPRMFTSCRRVVVSSVVPAATAPDGVMSAEHGTALKSFRFTRRKSDWNFVMDRTYSRDEHGRFRVTQACRPYDPEVQTYAHTLILVSSHE